jgi:hypothetical protein
MRSGLLEIGDLALERVLALAERLRLLHAIGARLRQLTRIAGNVFLLALNLRGLALRILDVALAARGLVLAQLPLRFTQSIGGSRGLAGRRRIALRGGAAHRVGGVAQLPRGVGQILALLIARQFLELARRFSACSASARCKSPLLPPADCPAARRCRSISCSWRRASSFSFSASSSIC